MKREAFKDANVYSVARFQPKGFRYPSLPFFAAVDVKGQKIGLRGREDPLKDYKRDLLKYYKSVWTEINNWMVRISKKDVNILCCWCPHASHSKEQMNTHNSFVCHTGIIGKIINSCRSDIDVYMDKEHSIYLVEEYKPFKYKELVL